MTFRILADAVVVIHLGFILFVVSGGFLALRWGRLVWLHVPAALWGALIMLAGWPCPLTPLEVWMRRKGGEAGYRGSFVEEYLLDIVYPPGLTRGVQIALGTAVVLVNLAAYTLLRRRAARR